MGYHTFLSGLIELLRLAEVNHKPNNKWEMFELSVPHIELINVFPTHYVFHKLIQIKWELVGIIVLRILFEFKKQREEVFVFLSESSEDSLLYDIFSGDSIPSSNSFASFFPCSGFSSLSSTWDLRLSKVSVLFSSSKQW